MKYDRICFKHNQRLYETLTHYKCPYRGCDTIFLKKELERIEVEFKGSDNSDSRLANNLLRECLGELLREDLENRIRDYLQGCSL